MPHQSANYEICLHTWYVTLWDCNIVTLLHCYIFMIHNTYNHLNQRPKLLEDQASPVVVFFLFL